MKLCAILHDDGPGVPTDTEGCRLPVNHGGQPHEYVAPNGQVIQWETDLACDCDHCMQCEGDYCTIYWPKVSQAALPAQGHDKGGET